MEDNQGIIKSELEALKSQAIYRRLRLVRNFNSYAKINGRKAINLSSNDYLGLSRHPKVIRALVRCVGEVSPCSSRLVAGNSPEISDLECRLAEHRRTESALVFPSGYTAVMGTLTAIADKKSIIFSDELNHASIVDGCRLSGAKILVFRHNDSTHLDELMNGNRGSKNIVITEGVFSITGEVSDLKSISKIASEHQALTLVDDAHGDFVFGPCGRGMPSDLRVNSLVDVHISSLSKGLGCFGGYAATSKDIQKLLINKSRQFIFTSALPSNICKASFASMRLAKIGNLQKRLFANIEMVRKWFKNHSFDIGTSNSQIICIQIGDEILASKFAAISLKNGVFIYPMKYPSVKRGSSVIRLSLTATHGKRQLLKALQVLEKVKTRLFFES